LDHALSRQTTESNFPDLHSEVSEEDREFVRDELAWLAEWMRSRYPKLNFGDIRRFLREMIFVSV